MMLKMLLTILHVVFSFFFPNQSGIESHQIIFYSYSGLKLPLPLPNPPVEVKEGWLASHFLMVLISWKKKFFCYKSFYPKLQCTFSLEDILSVALFLLNLLDFY
jgi:hypothetical protein